MKNLIARRKSYAALEFIKRSFHFASLEAYLDWFKKENVPSLKKYLSQKSDTNKVAVVTAIFGNYDELFIPTQLNTSHDYICFTDTPQNTYGVYKLFKSPYYNEDPTRMARYIKTHLHILLPNYDYIIWIDANIVSLGDMSKYLNEFENKNLTLAMVNHPQRKCLYDEADACIKLQKDDPDIIKKQIKRYKEEGIKEYSGMYETNFFISKNNIPKLEEFYRIWWNEIKDHSKRDQISVKYAEVKSQINIDLLFNQEINVRNHNEFIILPHDHLIFEQNLLKKYFRKELPTETK